MSAAAQAIGTFAVVYGVFSVGGSILYALLGNDLKATAAAHHAIGWFAIAALMWLVAK